MKNLNFILVCIIATLSMGSCSNNKKISNDLKTIVFDSNKSVGEYDIDKMIDTTYRIVALETNSDNLISKIDKLEMVDGKFYIMDCMAQSIFIFNADGSYIGKINKYGRGPGEYVNLSYMTVADNNIIVMDHMSGKQIMYNRESLQTVSEDYDTLRQIWCRDLFVMQNILYYINNWSETQSGKYHLYSKSANESTYSKYLPFKKEPVALGINGPIYGTAKDDALLIFSGDDHIYRVTEKDAAAKYLVEFKDKKAVYNSTPEKVFADNKGQTAVLGLNKIQQSERYIFAEVSFTGENDYNFIYDKDCDSITIYGGYAISKKLSAQFPIFYNRVIDNKIISWQDANTLLMYKPMQDQTHKTLFETELCELIANLPHDANPVLFIYDLKQ